MVRPPNDGVHLETPQAQTGSSSEGVRLLIWKVLRKVMIVFVILENEKTIESFEKYDVLRLWLG